MITRPRITWEDLREVHICELESGDQWIVLAPFTVTTVASDGRIRGWGWEQPRGTVLTLQSWVDGVVTAVSDSGEVKSAHVNGDELVNRVTAAAREASP